TLRFRNAPGCGAQEEPRSREGVRSREPVRLREILAAMSFAPSRYDDFLHVSIGRHITVRLLMVATIRCVRFPSLVKEGKMLHWRACFSYLSCWRFLSLVADRLMKIGRNHPRPITRPSYLHP